MAYIGNQPFTTAFLTDQFSGNGTTTAFTLSAAPANTNSLLVAVTGVLQDPSTYSVSGTTLTFSAAPPSGTGNISVRFLGIPASGVVTTAYRTLTEFTATAGQTTFTPPSYTVGYINVFRNGVMLGTADYTATNGTTVVLVNPASAGDLVVVESFYVSSVLNALPTSGGTLSGPLIATDLSYTGTLTGGTGVINIGSGQFYKDASGRIGLGTTSPLTNIDIASASSVQIRGSVGANVGLFGIRSDDGSTEMRSVTGAATFHTSNIERARIDSSGNLLVGQTSTSSKFAVTQAAADWCVNLNATASGTQYFNVFRYNGSAIGQITGNNSNTTYSTSSDYRLKDNVQPMVGALAKVAALKPCTWSWKLDGAEGQGFIAHELQAVVPDAVVGAKDAVDKDGNPVYQGVDTSFLVATLTAAIQELTAKLSAAEARIAALENKA